MTEDEFTKVCYGIGKLADTLGKHLAAEAKRHAELMAELRRLNTVTMKVSGDMDATRITLGIPTVDRGPTMCPGGSHPAGNCECRGG